MIQDQIMKSIIISIGNIVIPSTNIYFNRPQQPSGLSGFPYLDICIGSPQYEIKTQNSINNSFVSYLITIKLYTCQQGSNDQVSDQCVYQRGLEGVLNYLPPNTAWHYVTNLMHIIKQPSPDMTKDKELYQGKDVWISTNIWKLTVIE